MNFGQAIRALEKGKCVARRNWVEHQMFIYRIPPGSVKMDLVNKVRSIPQLARDILNTDDRPLIITPEIIVVDSNKVATQWVPLTPDIFAEDWEIVSASEGPQQNSKLN